MADSLCLYHRRTFSIYVLHSWEKKETTIYTSQTDKKEQKDELRQAGHRQPDSCVLLPVCV